MEIIVVQNDISQEGLRTLHVMSSASLLSHSGMMPSPSNTQILQIGGQVIPKWAEVKEWEDEIRLHHLSAIWRAREPIYYTFDQEMRMKKHPMVLWAKENGDSIRKSAKDAAFEFYDFYGYWPSAAWVKTWPKGLKVEDAYIPIIDEDYGLDLFAVWWGIDGFVIVGGGFNFQKNGEKQERKE